MQMAASNSMKLTCCVSHQLLAFILSFFFSFLFGLLPFWSVEAAAIGFVLHFIFGPGCAVSTGATSTQR